MVSGFKIEGSLLLLEVELMETQEEYLLSGQQPLSRRFYY